MIIDHLIRILDSSQEAFLQVKTIEAKDINWSILDIAFSPDGQYFCYSTWSPYCKCTYTDLYPLCKFSIYFFLIIVHLSRASGDSDDVLHPLNLNPNKQKFGVFSLAFSKCGKEIMGGASDGNFYLYDREVNRRTLRVKVVSLYLI